jgi:phage gp36-like protein
VAPYTDKDAVRIILARDLDQVDGTAASLTDEAIDDAIAEAQARVDTRLSGNYDVPFENTIPAMVVVITRDIAAWLAHLTFREVRDLNSELDPVHLRYKAAESLLIDLQNGRTTLPDVPGADPGESGKASIVINETTSDLFTECDFNLTRRWPTWP